MSDNDLPYKKAQKFQILGVYPSPHHTYALKHDLIIFIPYMKMGLDNAPKTC